MAEDKKTKIQETIEKAKEAIKPKEEKKEEKIELEREYVIPIRKRILKVPRYKRAKRAIKTIKEFLAKHMKVENRDIRKVKIDRYLNEEVWFKGIKKPITKIKVKAKKINGVVYAELAEIPEVVQYKINKETKFKERLASKGAKKPKIKEEKKLEEKVEEVKTEEKVKEEKIVKKETPKPKEVTPKAATTTKHTKKVQPVRKVMKK